MSIHSAPVLVTGATGKQGGASVHALLGAGTAVRALVRDPASDRAVALADAGAEIVVGDLTDRGSLDAAVAGVRGVFSVQMPPFLGESFDYDSEVAQGENLIFAAAAAGVEQFVQSTTSGAGDHYDHPEWDAERWPSLADTFSAKSRIQDRVRGAGFVYWTIIKPGFFMDNLVPSARFLFPRGVEGGLVSVLKPTTGLSLTAVSDIGKAAAAAFSNPSKFHTVELELASEYLSMTEIAAIVSEALGTELAAPDMSIDDAIAAGMPYMGISHDWINVAGGQPGRPEYAHRLGITDLVSFRSWAREHLTSEQRTRPIDRQRFQGRPNYDRWPLLAHGSHPGPHSIVTADAVGVSDGNGACPRRCGAGRYM